MTQPFQIDAKYGFTMSQSLAKSVKLEDGEKAMWHGEGIAFTGIFLQRPARIVLTDRRLLLLKHYVFSPDKIFSIPYSEITALSLTSLGWLKQGQKAIVLQCPGSEVRFALYTNRYMRGHSDPDATGHFFKEMEEFLKNKGIRPALA